MLEFGLPPIAPSHARFAPPEESLMVIALALHRQEHGQHLCERAGWYYLTRPTVGWNAAPVEIVQDHIPDLLCRHLEDVEMHQHLSVKNRQLCCEHPEWGTYSASLSDLKSMARIRRMPMALNMLKTKFKPPGT
jgi:hypothetical protein